MHLAPWTKWPVTGFLGLAWIGSAGASRIDLRVESRAGITNDTLHVQFHVRNRGTVEARDLAIVPRGMPAGGRPAVLDRLGPGDDAQMNLERILDAPEAPGQYVAGFVLRYRDRSGHGASVGLVAPYTVGPPPGLPPPLVLAVEPLRVRRTGLLNVIGAAPGGIPLTPQITVVLPDEFETDRDIFEWTVAPGGSLLRIPVSVRNVRPGSRYPVHVIARVETSEGPRVVLAAAMLDIAAPRIAVGWTPGLLAVALLLLAVAALPRRRPDSACPQGQRGE